MNLRTRTENSPQNVKSGVKLECMRRIVFVANEGAQLRLQSNYSLGNLSVDDAAVYPDLVAWIESMTAACRALDAAQDWDYANDSKWPEPSAAVVELASRY